MKRMLIILMVAGLGDAALAKMDLATLPERDAVQLTIYNSADLTLVRESRPLTLKDGKNKLQFSWANTLIDPTSLAMQPKADAEQISVADLSYPPRVRNLGLWNIESGLSGSVPVEISYLTSGLSWRAFYMGTLSDDEQTMRLQGYVRVTNRSGEDYANAQTRLIVGQVHLLDEIADLARRRYPYDRPHEVTDFLIVDEFEGLGVERDMALAASVVADEAAERPKEIKKEGLSEYFLYTIEGKETIPDGWSKRLLSFDTDNVPVVNLYKYEQERYGDSVRRFLSFKNDADHQLGETPIPGGMLKVYRTVDDAQHLTYVGQSEFKYIPVDEDVELDLGAVDDVVVKPTLMDFRTENYKYDPNGNIAGWDEIRTFKIEAKNTRAVPVEVRIQRNFGRPEWELTTQQEYEKVDLDTVKFTLMLEPRSRQEFEYVFKTSHEIKLVGQKHLIGWWKLDEGSGTTAHDSARGNHGTLFKGPNWTSGRVNGALEFDGDDDYVAAGRIPALSATDDFAWSLWANLENENESSEIIILGNRAGVSGSHFIKFTPGAFEYYNDGGEGTIYYDVPTEVWVHLAVVKDARNLKYYSNGRVVGTNDIRKEMPSNPLYFGGDPDYGEYAALRLDEVRLYDRALSAKEIRGLYKSALRGF
ncbi:MAG: LamG-like jellyroll fold domain-containing protein [Planctomycetota bacterium]